MTEMQTEGVLKPGDRVLYVDERSRQHHALVTIYHDGGSGRPGMACNLVYVSGDETKSDPNGRQIERASSVQAKNDTAAHGRYYEVL